MIGPKRICNTFYGSSGVFFLASSLKINLLKTKLISVKINYFQIQQVAREIGCIVINFLSFIWVFLLVRL